MRLSTTVLSASIVLIAIVEGCSSGKESAKVGSQQANGAAEKAAKPETPTIVVDAFGLLEEFSVAERAARKKPRSSPFGAADEAHKRAHKFVSEKLKHHVGKTADFHLKMSGYEQGRILLRGRFEQGRSVVDLRAPSPWSKGQDIEPHANIPEGGLDGLGIESVIHIRAKIKSVTAGAEGTDLYITVMLSEGEWVKKFPRQ